MDPTLPALPPPLGKQSNFQSRESQSYVTVIPCAVIVGIMIILVFIRMYTKAYILKSVGWDDCTLACLSEISPLVLIYLRYMHLCCSKTHVPSPQPNRSLESLDILLGLSGLFNGM